MTLDALEKLNLKAFLVGHYGSKKILPASSFLNKKYLPSEIEVIYLNFGNVNKSKIQDYSYMSFGYFNSSKKYWSANLSSILKKIKDEYILLGLDDFFLSKKLNVENFLYLYDQLINNENYISAELTLSPMEKLLDKNLDQKKIYVYPKSYGFSINTQWRIWKRKYLIYLLEHTTDAWNFEVLGSNMLNNSDNKSISSYSYVLDYPEISAVTQRNKGKVSVFANQYKDIDEMIDLGYLKSNELILGQWKNGIPSFKDYGSNQYEVLKLIPDEQERLYYKLLLDRCLD